MDRKLNSICKWGAQPYEIWTNALRFVKNHLKCGHLMGVPSCSFELLQDVTWLPLEINTSIIISLNINLDVQNINYISFYMFQTDKN